MSVTSPILVTCHGFTRNGWRDDLRHRWETVRGIYSTAANPYTERRCKRCGIYESEVR